MNELAGWIAGLIAFILPGFGADQASQYYGYIEANYVYVAPASAGRVASIDVEEGASVFAGDQLFSLSVDQFEASLRAAKAREAVAAANLQNMETGSRDPEVAVIRASLEKARADQALALATLERTKQLYDQGLTPAAKLDTDQARLDSANAQISRLGAQLEVAELPARHSQLVAARASLEAAKADADRARSALLERTVLAPQNALVEQIYFRVGEVAAAGAPVVVLLPPGALKARFFIPEADRMAFALGDELWLSCDGCPEEISATLSYMSSDPQHTPPIIYSREQRSRLVFLAEAGLSDDYNLLPGQPVGLTLKSEVFSDE